MRWAIRAAMLLAAFSVVAAQADTLVLNDGNIVECRIIAMESNHVVFLTSAGMDRVRVEHVHSFYVVGASPPQPAPAPQAPVEDRLKKLVEGLTGEPVARCTVPELKSRAHELHGQLVRLQFTSRGDLTQIRPGLYATTFLGNDSTIRCVFDEAAHDYVSKVATWQEVMRSKVQKTYYLFGTVVAPGKPETPQGWIGEAFVPIGRKKGKTAYEW